VPWFNGKTLEDPVRKLKEPRRKQVAEWVMVVRQIVSNQASSGTKLTGPLLTLLKDFAKDLHEPTSNREKFETEEIQVILDELPSDMPLVGNIWKALGKAHAGEGSGRSDLEMEVSNERNDRYIVIDQEFAKQLSQDPHDVRVYN